MKRHLLLFVMAGLLLLPVVLKAQDIVEISNGNHNQFTEILPTYTATNYSLSEQIYTAAEIGRGGLSTVSRSKARGILRPAMLIYIWCTPTRPPFNIPETGSLSLPPIVCTAGFSLFREGN